MTELPQGVTEDAFLGGKLRLRQPKSGHRVGHDAILLAAATPARPGDRVADLGTGVGAAGLAVAKRVGGLELVLAEIDAALADLARANAHVNAVVARTVVLDVGSDAKTFVAAGLDADSFDVVLMNPPFNDPARHRASPDAAREIAHMAADATLVDWVHASRRILKSGGRLVMIWRADGIDDVLAALGRGFGSIMILPVHADAASPAIRVLVRASKGAKAPLQILAGFVLNDESGLPKQQAQQILLGNGSLPLAVP